MHIMDFPVILSSSLPLGSPLKRTSNLSLMELLSSSYSSSRHLHFSFSSHLSNNIALPSNPQLPMRRTIGHSKLLTLSNNRTLNTVALRVSRREVEDVSDGGDVNMDGRMLINSVVTIGLAVASRVLYKLALVPMKQYPFFLAQVTTFGYVAVYFSILFFRYSAGIVTKEMLALPKSWFVAMGLLEALGLASGMSAGAMLPGPAIPILSQTFLVWQLILSVLFLRRKYSSNQIFGCLLVTAGVVLAVASGGGKGQFLSEVGLIWPALMVTSSAFQAGASILKEYVFKDGTKRLQGKSPDIFVVNSFGSGFQALFVFLLLPFLSNLKGIPFAELPDYVANGAACFLNLGDQRTDCGGAPLLPLLYIAFNLTFNISRLKLLKMSSALISSLAVTLAVPLSIYVLSLPLPYLSESSCLSTNFVIGTVILVVGLILYNIPQKRH